MGAAILTPLPAHAVSDLTPASVEVDLAAFNDPLVEVAGTLKLLNKYLFDPSGPVPVSPGAGTELPAWGLVPQFASDPFPILNHLGTNMIRYLVQTARGAIKVVSQVAAGQLVAAGVTAVRTLAYAPAAMLNHAYFLAQATPDIIGYFTKSLGAQVQAITDVTVKTAVGIAIGLTTNNPAFAWNTAIAGLLGPYGIPGVVLSLTIGAGLPSTGPVFVPSLRTEITTAVERIGYVLSSLSPVPAPAAARSMSGLRTAVSSRRPRVPSPKATHAASRGAHKQSTGGRAGSGRKHGH